MTAASDATAPSAGAPAADACAPAVDAPATGGSVSVAAGVPGKARAQQVEAVARDVVEDARLRLAVAFPALAPALLGRAATVRPLAAALATDGSTLAFDPERTVRAYRGDSAAVARDLLQATLHCLFLHPFAAKRDDARAWNLACDVAAEAAALDVCAGRFACARDERLGAALARLHEAIGPLTSANVYRCLRERASGAGPLSCWDAREAGDLAACAACDDHALWNRRAARALEPAAAGMRAGGSGDGQAAAWRARAAQVAAALRAAGSTEGVQEGGAFACNLRLARREPARLEGFLRTFCAPEEVLRASDEEFDVIAYTYGLARSGNLPLIEPVEYRPAPKLATFAIAIDTSGSTQGALVRRFVTRALAAIRGALGPHSEVHLIQADARVQRDDVVRTPADVDALARSFAVRGGGGTDFRPVFAYLADRRSRGDLADLSGLLYFTDGRGTYPATPPPYRCAFAFLDDAGEAAAVPPWAARIVLSSADVMEGRQR